jgi:NAD(P)-dependent dehydrogenase (short-subunit alcohol dehydrogenase family)
MTIMHPNNSNASGQLLANKVALITGAGRGIGAAAAKLFALEGATVTLVARTESELRTVADEITAEGGSADYVIADLADAKSIEQAVQTTVERHGRLDIAFNNAGVSIGHTPMVDVKEDDFDLVTKVNYKGVWLAMIAEVKAIRSTAGKGAIVNNSSVGSFMGNPNMAAYGAAKRAVNSLTESAAIEYGPEGIRINAVAPGTTMTEMIRKWASSEPDVINRLNGLTPLGSAAEPYEIAQAAAWLLSDRASYVTGVVLRVDGGMRE